MDIEIEQEEDGRWIAEVTDIPGVLVYGKSREEAIQSVKALALRVISDRLDHGEPVPDSDEIGPSMMARIGRRTGLTPRDL